MEYSNKEWQQGHRVLGAAADDLVSWSWTGLRLHDIARCLAHSLTDAHSAGCDGRLPIWHGRERNGPSFELDDTRASCQQAHGFNPII